MGSARDPDRLARFQREAQVLASLNHPNIAAIHGLEESSGVRALVLELVDGPTLADRIAHGTIPLDEALPIAKQIAEALQAAHDHGVIHRDLKPSNIILKGAWGPTPTRPKTAASSGDSPLRISDDIVVKVLDFGLAKALDAARSARSSTSRSPRRITSPAFSGAGVILGTAAYMAPEQARGKAVDKRADIWAFGVVLYEMLTGKRPFRGDTMTDILAAVVGQEPDWTRVPAHHAAAVARLFAERPQGSAPRHRRHEAAVGGGAPGRRSEPTEALRGLRRRRSRWRRASRSGPLGGRLRSRRRPIRTHINLPENVDAASRNFTLSPDGRVLAFSAVGPDGSQRVWVRFLDSLEVRELPGTEGLNTSAPLFLVSRQPVHRLCRIRRKTEEGRPDLGGPPQILCDMLGPSAPGGSWNRDGVIVFRQRPMPRCRGFPSTEDASSPVTALDSSRKETPSCLPHVPPGRASFPVLAQLCHDAPKTAACTSDRSTPNPRNKIPGDWSRRRSGRSTCRRQRSNGGYVADRPRREPCWRMPSMRGGWTSWAIR